MTNQMFIGIGIFLWLYGTGTGFFVRGEETIRIPKWASLLLLNFQQVTPVATIFLGSLVFAVKKSVFWGMSARTCAHTPKYGGLSREFPKSLFLQTYGILIIVYGLFIAQIITDPLLKLLIGMLVPVIMARILIQTLENLR